VNLDDENWRTWPPPGGASSAPSYDPEPPPEHTELSTEALAGQAASCLREWGDLDKTAAIEEVSSPITLDGIWRHHDAHPIALLLLCLDHYGTEFVEWMPETVKLTLERDGRAVSNANLTKLMATKTLLASPSPWRQWEVFHWISRALAGQSPNFTYLEEPEIGHAMACANVMKILDPSRKTSIEVDKYVAAMLRNEGIHYAPPPIDFAQRELSQRKLRCDQCDSVHRDDNDTKCISCGWQGPFTIVHEFKESHDRAESLWAAKSAQPLERAVDGLPDDGVGNAVYRLLVAWDYARRARSQLLQQLRMIGGRR
jgi:hypothetical protein